MVSEIISFLEEHLLSCSWKEGFGVECLGCGLQRSLILLLKGDFIGAFKMYPPVYTLILMFVYLGLHLKFDFNKGSRVLLYLFILNVIIMIINYIVKINF